MYKYSCLMCLFEADWWESFNKKYIPESSLYIDPEDPSFGRELENHFTILYGLHDDVDLKQVKQILPSISEIDCKLHSISVFENEKYDVLKFDILTDMGKEINSILRQTFDYTNDFPNYHPHATIAYLKKGEFPAVLNNIKPNTTNILKLSKPYNILPVKYKYSFPNGESELFI